MVTEKSVQEKKIGGLSHAYGGHSRHLVHAHEDAEVTVPPLMSAAVADEQGVR